MLYTFFEGENRPSFKRLLVTGLPYLEKFIHEKPTNQRTKKKKNQHANAKNHAKAKSPQNPANKNFLELIAFEEATEDEKRALAALGSAEALDEVLETLDQILSAEGHWEISPHGNEEAWPKQVIKLTNLSL